MWEKGSKRKRERERGNCEEEKLHKAVAIKQPVKTTPSVIPSSNIDIICLHIDFALVFPSP